MSLNPTTGLVISPDGSVASSLASRMRMGSTILTWRGDGDAAEFGNGVNIAHGLAAVPIAILVSAGFGTLLAGSSLAVLWAQPLADFETSHINIVGRTHDGATPPAGRTVTVYWAVIA